MLNDSPNGKPAVVLTFHGVGRPERPMEPGEDQVWLDHASFLRILDVVAGRPEVEITFDDGNASDLALAVPALRERGLRASFFVLAGRLGEAAMLDADGVREMARQGMDIGSHGMLHSPWRRLDAARATQEIVQAKARLEDLLGHPVTQAACPYGAYDRRALAWARRAGFSTVFTSDGGPARRGQWLRARNTVRVDDSPESIARLLQAPAGGTRAAWTRRAKLLVKRWR